MTSGELVTHSDRQPTFALLLGAAWLLAAIQLLAQNWADTALTLADTDDAMRLAQLNDWLAGQSWYDLHQWRVAPGYESHWSRLIDAGLTGLLWMLGRAFDAALAERLMRTVWPMLWLLPTMGGAAAIAWRIAGREAALIALLLGRSGFRRFTSSGPAASIITMFRSPSRCCLSPRPSGRIACAGSQWRQASSRHSCLRSGSNACRI